MVAQTIKPNELGLPPATFDHLTTMKGKEVSKQGISQSCGYLHVVFVALKLFTDRHLARPDVLRLRSSCCG